MADKELLVRKVVVLGGGLAGWMTAAFLGKALQRTVSITVLEDPAADPSRDITNAAGQTSLPPFRELFFDYLGINEDEWMRECHATFGMAVRFVNWRTGGGAEATARTLPDGGRDHFSHPFGLLPHYDRVPLSHYWFKRRHEGTSTEPFDYACFREPPLMDAKKSPRWLDGRPATRYAWQFDTGLASAFLRRHAIEKQGAALVESDLAGVEAVRDERGHVTALRTPAGHMLEGDLFVDCSGFRGALINEVMGEPFIGVGDQLPCDSSITTVVPHDDSANGVEPYTSVLAMPAGWAWKIPLRGRFVTGHVYSGEFTTRQQAMDDLCALWGLDPANTQVTTARFRAGHTRRSWVKNVVAIGASACFLPPLEPAGVHLVITALHRLAAYFPDRTFNPAHSDRFNRETEDVYHGVRDFVQAHVVCAPRSDTPFWQSTGQLPLSPRLQEQLASYRAGLGTGSPLTEEPAYYGPPGTDSDGLCTDAGYYSILTGLGVLPNAPLPLLAHSPESVAAAQPLFDTVQRQQRTLLETLPTAHEYLYRLHGS
ncbi:2-polyprenyl-6-methoxyphenol hydroxylase-like FAD-dependent oxidoreductase [Streptomyces sp. LBL]|uniref:tryptophan halogenase family protein n=1 Tax=Streptomyces sp. LBL TaxID=2940562 RepID=UPI0024758D12|nr:tryptophan 7-halogenase [Streptomyces sp. LBL]MDH6626464.1 2-polyprenyl-6-methoxyphenol hydroxylase-like FAD-dependent oxidoreductase [Streptomyces sp. LBL]